MSADEPIGPVQLGPATHPEEENEQFRYEETEHEVRRERFDLPRLCDHSSPHRTLGFSGTCAAAGGSPRPPDTWTQPTGSRRSRFRCAEVARSRGEATTRVTTRATTRAGMMSRREVYSFLMYCWPHVS